MKLSISMLPGTQFPEVHHRVAATAARGLHPIAFRVPGGEACTFSVDGDRIEVMAGVTEGTTVIELPAEEWERFASEGWTRWGLLYLGKASFGTDGFSDLCRWEPVLRALFDGLPVWDPATIDLPDDLTESFELDDDRAATFLQKAGYLHVVNVFSSEEVEALRIAVEELAAGAQQGEEGVSWTTTSSGETVVCQVKYGNLRSPVIAALHDDARVRRILSFAGHPELEPLVDRLEGTKVIYKRPTAMSGLNELPWHTDCGMGLHPAMCPMVLVGVQVDAGTPENGQMHVLPGTHDKSAPDHTVVDTSDWPIVALTTAPGDCTVHFGHTLHWAPAPTDPGPSGRRTFYVVFASPTVFDAIGPGEDFTAAMKNVNGILLTPEEVLAAG